MCSKSEAREHQEACGLSHQVLQSPEIRATNCLPTAGEADEVVNESGWWLA